MKDQVAKAIIQAPFDGIVDTSLLIGANLARELSILRFVNLDKMHVAFEIHLPNIQLNSQAKITIPVLKKQWESKVSLIGNYINPNNRSFRIEINLNNKKGDLKPNMTAQVLLNDYTNPQALLVPLKIF